MRVYTGTSGFSYPEWKGSFYPEKIPAKAMLEFYATRLRTVELNNTFYRMPKKAMIEDWARRVSDEFLFSVKISRRVTHFKKLAQTGDVLDYFFEGLAAFGSSLGPVLIQCPPTLKCDLDLLDGFFKDVQKATEAHFAAGTRLRLAFEFRHPSWMNESAYALLARENAALVGGDVDDEAKSPPLVETGSHAYLRLRKTEYQEGEIAGWAEKIRRLNAEEVFVYFKHEVQGPALAEELKSYL